MDQLKLNKPVALFILKILTIFIGSLGILYLIIRTHFLIVKEYVLLNDGATLLNLIDWYVRFYLVLCIISLIITKLKLFRHQEGRTKNEKYKMIIVGVLLAILLFFLFFWIFSFTK